MDFVFQPPGYYLTLCLCKPDGICFVPPVLQMDPTFRGKLHKLKEKKKKVACLLCYGTSVESDL